MYILSCLAYCKVVPDYWRTENVSRRRMECTDEYMLGQGFELGWLAYCSQCVHAANMGSLASS
jgi:hypothetical protein